MESNESKVTIKIPRPLYNRIKLIVEGSGFNSVTGFVVYILRDIVSGKTVDEHELSADELAAIRKRLKSLGYL